MRGTAWHGQQVKEQMDEDESVTEAVMEEEMEDGMKRRGIIADIVCIHESRTYHTYLVDSCGFEIRDPIGPHGSLRA